jgi:peptidoglycan/LPS O-acetylase OafA/YrhL
MAGRGRFPLVDSARAIAALLVVGYHLAKIRPPSPGSVAAPYLHHLAFGVVVFFIISGFLLYLPFVSARADGSSASVGPYAARRVARIVPAYWVALTLVAVFGHGAPEVQHSPAVYYGFAQVYSSATVTKGIGQAWSLCIEITFYALLPAYAIVVAFAARRRRRGWLTEIGGLALLALAAYAWSAQIGGGHPNQVALHVLPRYLGHFACGMSLAALYVWVTRRGRAPRPIAWLMAHPSVPWLFVPFGYVLAARANLGFALGDVVDGLTAAAMLWPAVFAVPGRGIAGRVLGLRPLLFVGAVSYGVYLYHWAVIQRADHVLRSVHGAAGVVGLGSLAMTGAVIAGAASWYLVERPVIGHVRRLLRARPPDLAVGEVAPPVSEVAP